MVTVLALGTSEIVSQQNSTYKLYGALVRDYITANYRPAYLIQKGINGTTTQDCIKNFGWWNKCNPHLIIYSGMGNDMVKDKPDGQSGLTERVTLAQSKLNLQTIYNKQLEILRPNGHIIWTMPPYVDPVGVSRPLAEDYRQALTDFCAGTNTQGHIIDMPDFRIAWGINAFSTNTYDGTHLNTVGCGKVYNILLPYVLAKINKWV